MTVTVRKVSHHDCDQIFMWVNRPDSLRGKLRTTSAIEKTDHDAWFSQQLASDRVLMLIAEDDGHSVGQVRLHLDDADVAEVDIYVDAASRGRGIAHTLIETAASQWAMRSLRARVKLDNQASQKLFSACGFRLVETLSDHYVFERSGNGI